MASIGLGEAVEQLRAELEAAVSVDSNGKVVRFDVGPIELTLSVQVTKESTPGAKIKFWVVEAGADVSASTPAIRNVVTSADLHGRDWYSCRIDPIMARVCNLIRRPATV